MRTLTHRIRFRLIWSRLAERLFPPPRVVLPPGDYVINAPIELSGRVVVEGVPGFQTRLIKNFEGQAFRGPSGVARGFFITTKEWVEHQFSDDIESDGQPWQ